MKIVVLAGGISTERDVSIVSGTMVCKALREKGHQAILMDVFFGLKQIPESLFPEEYDVEGAAEEIRSHNDSLAEAVKARREFFGPHVIEICQKADVVFMALHGANGEDGKVQAAFDLFGIPYTGTGYLSSAVAMDKGLTKQFFETHGVPVPKGISLMKNQAFVSLEKSGLEFPVVVKPCCGGSSVGVFIAGNQEEYEAALQAAFAYEDELIVEEYVKGREFSVGVVDGKAYPIIEIAPIEGFYDYTNKYKAGSTIETCPAELTEEQTRQMQEYAVLGAESLGIEGYCRLDFMMRGDGRMYCLEANTLPGMTPTSLLPQEAQAIGIDYPSLCEELIRLSLKKYQG
jgi:D-alanine-D-alanine ligase